MTEKYFPLTPVLLKKDEYYDALDWAVKERKVNNIAVCGDYGSGKSSVVHSFVKYKESEESEFKCLNISMATFNNGKVEQEDDNEAADTNKSSCALKDAIASNKVDDSSSGESEASNGIEDLEKAILKHMFYQQDPDDLKASRFKQIKPVKTSSTMTQALLLCMFALFILLYLNPTAMGTDLTKVVSKTWLAIFAFVGVVGLVYQALSMSASSSLKKIGVLKGEVEFKDKKVDSAFYEYLDEIIYFFEEMQYTAVVFEDLDRFEDAHMVLSGLRDINQLLNKRRKINNTLNFIYVVKDDLFHGEDRTKFFEYILPIVPIIDSTNSSDMFRNLLEEAGLAEQSAEFNQLITDVSYDLSDVRLIKNIVNEYKIYRKKLKSEATGDDKVDLLSHKLLAIIIYKNLDPKDFSVLRRGQGNLAEVFASKQSFIERINENLSRRMHKLEEKEKNKDKSLSVDESNELHELKHEKAKFFHEPTLEDICYRPEVELIDDSVKHALVFNSLIRFGYIAEDYAHYISFFHGKNLNDQNFIQSVLYNQPKEFDYQLDDPAFVANRINPKSYDSESVLNTALFEHLAAAENNELLKLFIRGLSKRIRRSSPSTVAFFKTEIVEPSRLGLIAKTLMQVDGNLPGFIFTSKLFADTRDAVFTQTILSLSVADFDNRPFIRDYRKYLELHIELLEQLQFDKALVPNSQLTAVLKKARVRYSYDEKELSEKVENYLVKQMLFAVNLETLTWVLRVLGESDKLFKTKSYSALLVLAEAHSEFAAILHHDFPFKRYIMATFNNLENLDEDPESTIELLKRELGEELQHTILDKQKRPFKNILEIENTKLWPKLFERKLLVPTWSNVLNYYAITNKSEDLSPELLNYLNSAKFYQPLSKQSVDEEHLKLAQRLSNQCNESLELSNAALSALQSVIGDIRDIEHIDPNKIPKNNFDEEVKRRPDSNDS